MTTYRELFYKATRLINHAQITLGEYEEMTKPLDREVEQEPREGHWIRVDKDKLKCSKCDVIHFIAQYPQGKIAWCPNCGAKMLNPKECEKELETIRGRE